MNGKRPLNEYELQREENIRRNNERLKEVGVPAFNIHDVPKKAKTEDVDSDPTYIPPNNEESSKSLDFNDVAMVEDSAGNTYQRTLHDRNVSDIDVTCMYVGTSTRHRGNSNKPTVEATLNVSNLGTPASFEQLPYNVSDLKCIHTRRTRYVITSYTYIEL